MEIKKNYFAIMRHQKYSMHIICGVEFFFEIKKRHDCIWLKFGAYKSGHIQLKASLFNLTNFNDRERKSMHSW